MLEVSMKGIARIANSLLNGLKSDDAYAPLSHPIAAEIAQFLTTYKFEITTIPALVCVAAYGFFNRGEVLTATGAGKAFLAFLAGLAVPIGFVFGFAAYAPSQLNILFDFREYVLASGVMLLLLAATGIRKTIFP